MSGAPRQRLVVNARIATGDPRRPWADALLMEDGRVVATGSSAELRKRAPDAEVVDARGADVGRDGAPYSSRAT
jgi:predicted amidohydrolase YtcJ